MESLFDRSRRHRRNVQAVLLFAALAALIVLTAVTLARRKESTAIYTGRINYETTARADAPDGRYLESYHVGHFDQGVLFLDFVPTGIRICAADGTTLWEMPGRVVNSLFWSPDGRYAAISTCTDEGGATVVVDTTDWSKITLTPPAAASGAKIYYYAVSWDADGLHLCWDYGDKHAQGETVWKP